MWFRILALMRKEFLAVLRDRKSRFILIGPPVIQLLVFGYAATFDLDNIPYAVYNQDPGPASRALLARFDGSPNFRRVATLERDGEIAPLIDRKDALLVLCIGPRFTSDLAAGRLGAPLQVLIDGRNSNTALIALNYVRVIVNDFNRDWAERRGLGSIPAFIESRAWYNENLESRRFFIPGLIGLLTLVVTVIVTGLSVAREREQGTFDQLLVTPMRPVEILLGKALPGFVIGFFEATFIILVSVLWFRIPFSGHVVTLYTGLFLFLLSSIGFGLMISSLAVTQQQGLLGGFLFMVPAVILSGFVTPIANMPTVIQWITYLDPLRYFMVVIRGVFLEATPFYVLIHQFWPMACLGVVNLALAAWLFRHRMY